MAKKTIATTKKTTTPAIDEKAVQVVEKRLTKAESYAEALTITDDKGEKTATAALSELNKLGDEITGQKEELTKPLNAVLKAIRERYKPVETAHANAIRIIKGKLIAYHNAKQAAADKEAAQIAARAAKGTIKPETAVRKMDEIAPVEKNVKTEAGALQYKKVPVATITKEVTALTDKEIVEHARAGLLKWDEVAAKKAALAKGGEGEVLAGVTVTVETRAANIR